jgi:YfiH family protein
MKIIEPHIFDLFENIKAGQSTRIGGQSSRFGDFNLGESVEDDLTIVAQNRKIFCNLMNFELENLAKSKQVHGLEVGMVSKGGQYEGYDALITGTKGILLAVTIADCAPILLYDSINQAIAAIHAGWKGTVGGLLTKTIQMMTENYGTKPTDIYAYVGTCISGNNYEVDADVALHFDEKYRPFNPKNSKYYLNIKQHNFDQLISLGVQLSQIELSAYCTLGDKDVFYSHRGDKGQSGRMLAAIGMHHTTQIHAFTCI